MIWRFIKRVFDAMAGPRCPWCDTVSPHRMPHTYECPWWRLDKRA